MSTIKSEDVVNKDLFVGDTKIGAVKGIFLDPENWKLTHLEIELNKEATKEILGAKSSSRNKLAISALEKGNACCTKKGVELKISIKQIPIYLRPIGT